MAFRILLKRFVPFFAALFIGMLVTSFFVDLRRPRFERYGCHRMHQWQEMQRLRLENDELRSENEMLRNVQMQSGIETTAPPVAVLDDSRSVRPTAPPAPKARR